MAGAGPAGAGAGAGQGGEVGAVASPISAPVDPGGCEGRAGQGLWGPFLAFLRRRRSVVLEELREADRAPSWLLREVEQYLPEDVACLFGPAKPVIDPSSQGLGSSPPLLNPGGSTRPQPQPCLPVMLHADLTAHNIWVAGQGTPRENSPPATCASNRACNGTGHGAALPDADAAACGNVTGAQLVLLDWADAGCGCPLYDFVSLHVSVFDLQPQHLRACWQAYRRRLKQCEAATDPLLPGCPDSASGVDWVAARPAGSVPLSRVAMCYSLLHEEQDLLPRLQSSHPQHMTPPLLRATAHGHATNAEQGATISGGETESTAKNGARVCGDGEVPMGGNSSVARGPPLLEHVAQHVWGPLDDDDVAYTA
ncbi:hypothetical protein V8C86DRAFT_2460691 [Haematococcus lacustris]